MTVYALAQTLISSCSCGLPRLGQVFEIFLYLYGKSSNFYVNKDKEMPDEVVLETGTMSIDHMSVPNLLLEDNLDYDSGRCSQLPYWRGSNTKLSWHTEAVVIYRMVVMKDTRVDKIVQMQVTRMQVIMILAKKHIYIEYLCCQCTYNKYWIHK